MSTLSLSSHFRQTLFFHHCLSSFFLSGLFSLVISLSLSSLSLFASVQKQLEYKPNQTLTDGHEFTSSPLYSQTD